MDAIHILGAGGIGCAIGYALVTAGRRVVFVDADPEKIAWGRQNGVQVDQRPPLRAMFEHFADWTPDAASLLLLCTKCYDNSAVLARLSPDIGLIPIQNGFDKTLAARGHRLEGIASFVSECFPGRTHTRITRKGRLYLGFRGLEAGPSKDAGRLKTLAGWLRQGLFPVDLVSDILPYKYTKLMYNAAISPLAAAAGLDNGQLLSVPAARRLFFDLLRENYSILHGAGIPLGKIGPFHPNTVQRILRSRVVAGALAWAFTPSLRGSYCSMSGDLPRGRTEIDYYNQHLVDLAGSRPAPLNRRLVECIKRMEKERIVPSLEMLERIGA